MEKRFGAFTSSTNPNEIADRVKGAILAMSGILLIVLPLAGISVSAEQITTFAGQLGVAAGALWTLYGFGKWAVAFFTEIKEQ